MLEDKKKGITSSAGFSIVTPNYQPNGKAVSNKNIDAKELTDPYTSSFINPETNDRVVQNNLPIRTGKSAISRERVNNLFIDAAKTEIVKPSSLTQGKPFEFNADLRHAKFERYYNHPKFKQLGFHPLRDNETFYNKHSSGWDDFRRSWAQWGSLFKAGFWDAMSFGPTSDRARGEQFERAMAIGQSSRGGFSGFATNLFLNSGYTFGIISEMLAEEAVLFLASIATGGALAPTMITSFGSKLRHLNKLDDAYKVSKILKQGRQYVKAIDNLKDVSKARKAWEYTKNVGRWVGGKLTPESANFLRSLDKMKDFSSFAKTSAGFASFYKDIRNIRLAYGESSLEAGMVENEMLDQLYQEKKMEVGGRSLTEEEMFDIQKRAKDAAFTTFKWNVPVIWGSNQIVLDNLFHTFSPTRRLLSEPLYKNAVGQVIKTGSRVAPLEIAEYGVKGFFKSLTKPRTYLRTGLNYFKANIAEGIQETAQEIISKTAKDYHRLDTNDQVSQNFYALMLDSAKSQWSPEGLETFASGFFMGGPVSMVTGGVSKVVDKVKQFRDPNYANTISKAKADLADFVMRGNEYLTDPNKWHNSVLEKAITQKKIQEGLEEAKDMNDSKGFGDAQFGAEFGQFIEDIEKGYGDLVIESLEELKQISDPEELAELFPKLSEKDLPSSSIKIDEKINMIKEMQRDWKDIQKAFPNPSNPSVFKPGTEEQRAAANDYLAWQVALKSILYNKYAVKDGIKRMTKILDYANNVEGLKDRSSDDITNLYSLPGLKKNIKNKGELLAAYSPDIIYNNDTYEIKGIESFKQQVSETDYADFEKKLNEFDALVDYSNKMQIFSGTSKTSENFQSALDNLQESYNTLLKMYSENTIYSDQLESMFGGVLEYIELGAETAIHREVVDTLLNPQQFLKFHKELTDAAKLSHEQRLPYLKTALAEFMKHMATQQLVNDLYYADQQENFKENYSPGGSATQGMFFDPQQLDELVNGEPPVEPTIFYYVSDGHEQVLQTSKDYKIAKSIIRHYIRNIREIEIEGAVPETEYNTKTRDKLPGDERTYEDLAEQFGFDATKEKTVVSKRKVLQAIIENKYETATEREQKLAAELLKITEESESITFVNNHTNPGSYYSDTNTIIIDARYNSYDYKGGTIPIEYIILHEEIHSRTVEAYKTDTEFKSAIDNMLEVTEEATKDLPEDQKPYYGTKNALEFIAEAMTNEEFQKQLGQIEYDVETKKSVWASFVDSVLEFLSQVFGKKEVSNTVLNGAIDIITSKIESEFAEVKDESISIDKVSPSTPFSLFQITLQNRLIRAFEDFSEAEEAKPVEERALPVKEWKRLNEKELASSAGFKNWVRNSDTAADIISDWNNEAAKLQEVSEAPLYYRGKNPTSTVLLTKEVDGQTQVLLVKRADGAVEENKWALPGGFVDSNAKEGYQWRPGKETTQEAAVREVKEETGLDVEEFDIESIYLKDNQDRDPRNTEESWIEDHGFRINLPEDFDMDPVGQTDAKEAKWFTLEELNELNSNEIAFDHAEILAENNLRDVVEESTGEIGDLKVGDTVKINTPKDGTGVIKSIKNGKVTLEDGRHGILLQNVEKVSLDKLDPTEAFNQSSASNKKAALVQELKDKQKIEGQIKINPKTGETADKIAESDTTGYIVTDNKGREFTVYVHDKMKTLDIEDFPTKGDLLQSIINDKKTVKLKLIPKIKLGGKSYTDVIAVTDVDTNMFLGYVRETDSFETKPEVTAEEAPSTEKAEVVTEQDERLQEELNKIEFVAADMDYYMHPDISTKFATREEAEAGVRYKYNLEAIVSKESPTLTRSFNSNELTDDSSGLKSEVRVKKREDGGKYYESRNTKHFSGDGRGAVMGESNYDVLFVANIDDIKQSEGVFLRDLNPTDTYFYSTSDTFPLTERGVFITNSKKTYDKLVEARKAVIFKNDLFTEGFKLDFLPSKKEISKSFTDYAAVSPDNRGNLLSTLYPDMDPLQYHGSFDAGQAAHAYDILSVLEAPQNIAVQFPGIMNWQDQWKNLNPTIREKEIKKLETFYENEILKSTDIAKRGTPIKQEGGFDSYKKQFKDILDALKKEHDEITETEPTIEEVDIKEEQTELNEAEKRKAEKLKPLLEERERLQEKINKLKSLIDPSYKASNTYFDYPQLPYEEGLNNVLRAFDKIGLYEVYNVDQIEQLLIDLGASEFIITEFNKIKNLAKESGVVMRTSLGQNMDSLAYGQFMSDENHIMLNLGLLLADPKVETEEAIARIILHELIHSVTVYKVLSYQMDDIGKEAPLSSKDRAAIKDIENIMDEIWNLPEFQGEYGTSNVQEMLAELSNQNFVNKLKNTGIKGKSLLERLINAIIRLLTGIKRTDNAYERLYAAYETLLVTDPIKQRESAMKIVKALNIVNDEVIIPKDTAIRDRKIEYDLLIEQSEMTDIDAAWSAQGRRYDRLENRSLYNDYKTDSGDLNINLIRKQIKDLENQIAAIDAQIEQIESDFYQQTGERRTYLLPSERKALETLGYTRADMRVMGAKEAREIIQSGQRVEDRKAITSLKKQDTERKVKERKAKERAQIRKNFTKLLENITNFEEFAEAKEHAMEILANPTRLEDSGYSVEEIQNMLDAKKSELSKEVNFEILKVGDVVMLGESVDRHKYVVTKKTKKQLKIRKFGDPAAEERAVNAQDVTTKIKYMSKDIEEPSVPPTEPTAEEKNLIRSDQNNVKEVLDPDAVDQILLDSLNKTDDEANDDWSNSMRDNCAG